MIQRFVFYSLFLSLFLVSVGETKDVGQIKREKCAICHIYESIFFDKTMGEEMGTATGGEKELCLSCHNGSVVDSREKLLMGHQHPETRMEKMNVKNGKKTVKKGCTVCHNPHTKIGWEGYAGTDISIYTGGDRICLFCHQNKVFSGKGDNHAYGKRNGCLSCHTLHGASTKSLLKDRHLDLCKRCHESIYAFVDERKGHVVGKVKKKPVIIRDRFSLDKLEEVDLACNVCHDLHSPEEGKNLLRMEPDDLCHRCHKGFVGAGKGNLNNGNHPSAAACTDCHIVHLSDENRGGKGMGAKNIEPSKVCANCHRDFIENTENKWNHNGGADGKGEKICFRCHSMHKGVLGSSNLVTDGDVVCLDCHSEENTLNEQTARSLTHPLFEVVSDNAIYDKISTFGGKTGKFGEIICRSCHSVHNGVNKKLLLVDEKTFCNACHEQVELEHGGRKHPCSECHYPHGVTFDDKGDPKDIIKGICFKCHEKKTGHNEAVAAKQKVKQESMPLFDRRGKRSLRGAISCPTCHEVHGENEFGSYLRKNYFGSTFLCVSCHPEKEKVSLTPHDLRSIMSESLCEPCHLSHGGGDAFMWGLTEKEDSGETNYCKACHSEGGLSSPIHYGDGHPVNITPSLKEGIPVKYYDSTWTQNELGMIACPTCHDVHGEEISLSRERDEDLLHLTYRFGNQTGYIERESFCTICHIDKKDMKKGIHGSFDCESCHQAHEDHVPPENEKGFSWFCLQCHKEVPSRDATVFNIIEKEMPREEISNDSIFLYNEFGKKDDQGRVSCPSCHEVHSGKKSISLSFKGQSEDETCYGCHPEKRDLENSDHDLSDREGRGCRMCHGICVESFPADEVGRITDEFRGNPADGKCLYCHFDRVEDDFYLFHPKNVNMVKTTYGAMVPIESDITMVSKMKGDPSVKFPLFNSKGEKGMSGALGCLTCHDPHKGNTIKNRRKDFLRDETALFISSMCAKCHGSGAEERVKKFHSLKRKEE